MLFYTIDAYGNTDKLFEDLFAFTPFNTNTHFYLKGHLFEEMIRYNNRKKKDLDK